MVKRIALLLGSLAAVAVLTIALAAASFAPVPRSPAAARMAPQTVEAAADVVAPQPTTQVDTVYVQPAPPRKTIRVLRSAATMPPIVIHRVVTAPAGGEHEGGSGGQTSDEND